MLPTKTGWRPVRAIDLRQTGEAPGTCERCGRHDLRFLHEVAHDVEGQAFVGCECAKRICHGYAPEREERKERKLRNLYARRSRWLTRNWGRTWKGNETLTFKHDGDTVRVIVYPCKFNKDRFCFTITAGGEVYHCPQKFASKDAAKLGAFDELAELLDW